MKIFVLGALSFGIATASGVLFAKFMNLFLKNKINPLIRCCRCLGGTGLRPGGTYYGTAASGSCYHNLHLISLYYCFLGTLTYEGTAIGTLIIINVCHEILNLNGLCGAILYTDTTTNAGIITGLHCYRPHILREACNLSLSRCGYKLD